VFQLFYFFTQAIFTVHFTSGTRCNSVTIKKARLMVFCLIGWVEQQQSVASLPVPAVGAQGAARLPFHGASTAVHAPTQLSEVGNATS